jgi:pimeloyl-ACP methyl ester carboxylesterase
MCDAKKIKGVMSTIGAAVGCVVLLLFPASSQPSQRGEVKRGDLKIEPYSLTTYDGKTHAVELGHLWVPENRRKPSSRLVQVAFVRLKATGPAPAAPIVFLSGGPGVPATVLGSVPVYYELFEKLRQVADVIFLDQRGSGLSSPNLNDCPSSEPFPADAFSTQQRFVEVLAHFIASCASYWRSQGVDLTGYNTEESSDDIDDLRRALGAAKISLLGHSYGTELGLSVIRRHGGAVERAVLAGVEGPGDHGTVDYRTMPGILDLQLRKIGRLVAVDPAWSKAVLDLSALFQEDVVLLEKHPLSVTVTQKATKAPITLTAGAFALRFIVAQLLPNGRAVAALPALLLSVKEGDNSLLQQQLEGLYNNFDQGVTLMGRAMNCAAVSPPDLPAQPEANASASLFGNIARIDVEPQICRAVVGDFKLGPEYFAPLYSVVPSLFLSGTLDSNTPAMKAERMRWGFPLSTQIVVENGFHETLPDDDVQALVVDFFKGQDVAGRRVMFPPPHFLSASEAKSRGRR